MESEKSMPNDISHQSALMRIQINDSSGTRASDVLHILATHLPNSGHSHGGMGNGKRWLAKLFPPVMRRDHATSRYTEDAPFASSRVQLLALVYANS